MAGGDLDESSLYPVGIPRSTSRSVPGLGPRLSEHTDAGGGQPLMLSVEAIHYAKIASRTVADEYFAVTDKAEAL